MNHPNQEGPTAADQAVAAEEGSFADLLTRFEEAHRSPTRGGDSEPLPGAVIAVTDEAVYIDIGRKMEGVLGLDEVRARDGSIHCRPGDVVPVTVTGRDQNGYYTLSRARIVVPKDWAGLEKAFAEKASIPAVVEEVIKGGLRVSVGVPAFLPASRSGVPDTAGLGKLVGETIQCRIIKLDTAREDVVVDRRAVLEEEERLAKERALDALREGELVRGTVRTLTDYGAFVDLGMVDGLLHVTDMSWGRVAKPGDLLKTGDSVEVKILKIDRDARRVSLGLKQLTPDPWTLAGDKYKPGDRVKGKVVRLADFGAFVELEPGVEGLIRLAELSWSKKVRKPSDVVRRGEFVEVAVLEVNAAERRIGLGLKQVLGDPWDAAQEKYAPGAIVERPVNHLANFGAFVELEDGVEGLIHIGDITREKRLQHPKEALSVGQVVKAVVLEIDSERRRIRLGLKQLEPTTADEVIAETKPGDEISGRIVEISGDRAKVELGEGVTATCRLTPRQQAAGDDQAAAGKSDLGALSAMLAAKWKGAPAARPAPEAARAGQVRRFRVVSLTPAEKRIELELIG